MDLILELMSRVINLTYDVNQLMTHVDSSSDPAFIEAAEKGLDHRDFEFTKDEYVELFKKRKSAFQINNQIVMLIQELSPDEKADLADKVNELVGLSKTKYVVKENEYQELIGIITQPSFSFEGNEGLKERIVELKEEYSRYHAAAIYYDNMSNYLKSYARKK